MRAGFTALLVLFAQAAFADVGYEERLVQWALNLHQRELEPSPEGKTLEEVLIASEEVFAPSDPYPSWFNAVHMRTREVVIRRELLFAQGEAFDSKKVAETERNLRSLFIFSIAKVLPVKGKRGGVALLVVTQDRWSLRLNSEFNVVGPLLQFLRLRPTEQNFLGLNQQVLLDLVLRLDTLSVGQLYQDRRFLGSELSFGETAAIILNRQTGEPEGSAGAVVLGKPLFHLESRWGFSVGADWSVRTRRIFRGAEVWQLPYPNEEAPLSQVPYIYLQRVAGWNALYTRSFGRALKADVSAGVGGFFRRYAPPLALGLDPAQSAWFASEYLPRSEDASFLQASVAAYVPDYRVLRDVDTFELSEDVQVGPSAYLAARWAHPAFFSPSRFVELGARLRYQLLAADDLATLTVAGASRYLPGEARWVNQRLAAEVKNVTPQTFLGRLVTRAVVDLTRERLDNRQALLGGGNGLRGAAPESLAGRNYFLANVEWRSRSFEVKTLFLGLVLFYDTGSAWDVAPAFTHTVGAGLRLLIPQFNQETIRVDVGWVLSQPAGFSIDRFSGSFGQVTDYRPAFLDQPLE
ncbi:MAG: hypothetical protein ACOZIN_16080 [Myxococcota bacterium]